jgi:hypothetical protein
MQFALYDEVPATIAETMAHRTWGGADRKRTVA